MLIEITNLLVGVRGILVCFHNRRGSWDGGQGAGGQGWARGKP